MLETGSRNTIIELERELLASRVYVEWENDNLLTHSTKYQELLLSAGDALESYITLYCEKNAPSDNNAQKTQYRITDLLRTIQPCMYSRLLQLKDTDIIVAPYDYYETRKGQCFRCSPPWWKTYNSLKHGKFTNQNDCMRQSNLKTVISAIAGLVLIDICSRQCHSAKGLTLSLIGDGISGDRIDAVKRSCSCRNLSSSLFKVIPDSEKYYNKLFFSLNANAIISIQDAMRITAENSMRAEQL